MEPVQSRRRVIISQRVAQERLKGFGSGLPTAMGRLVTRIALPARLWIYAWVS
jgi:hypothetical protein